MTRRFSKTGIGIRFFYSTPHSNQVMENALFLRELDVSTSGGHDMAQPVDHRVRGASFTKAPDKIRASLISRAYNESKQSDPFQSISRSFHCYSVNFICIFSYNIKNKYSMQTSHWKILCQERFELFTKISYITKRKLN